MMEQPLSPVAALSGQSPLAAPEPRQAPAFSAPFLLADKFTARHEGGYNPNDVGAPANFGINQAAHPGVDVKSLNARQAQAMRHQYWADIHGDDLARLNPALALIAYDTAIMAGAGRAKEMLKKSGGDAEAMFAQRQQFLAGLVAAHPEKFKPVERSWNSRNADLAKVSGQVAQMMPPGSIPPKQPSAPSPLEPSIPPSDAAPPEKKPMVEPEKAPEKPPEEAAPPIQAPVLPAAPPAALAATTQDRYKELLKSAGVENEQG